MIFQFDTFITLWRALGGELGLKWAVTRPWMGLLIAPEPPAHTENDSYCPVNHCKMYSHTNTEMKKTQFRKT